MVMCHRSLLQVVIGLVLLWGASGVWSSAQTFTSLHSFAGTTASDGSAPGYGALVQGFDGNLYGTTTQGGVNCSFFGAVGCGEVFKITPGGKIKGIYKFCPLSGCVDGNDPQGGLALNTDGSLYGMTDLGGTAGIGAVFRTTPAGALSTLYSFDNTIGSEPLDTLFRASNGNFYGFTQTGGPTGYGAIFRFNSTGVPTLVQSFNGTDGTGDASGGLVQGTDGNFYGVSPNGNNSQGTVFKMTPAGKINVLHTFTGIPDGSDPAGTLVQGLDGNFYGTTRTGGANGQGTVFRTTPGGVLTILYNFCMVNGCPDGFDPVAGLIQGTDGNFYGTTLGGGTGSSPGTVFRITSGGVLTTLHSFSGLDGTEPFAGLVQHTNGTFYGTTNAGGTNGLGTVFSVSVGLGPFARTLPSSGRVGTAVKILGGSLVGTTAVSFNGTAAVFQVVSSTEITTTVPVGATSGFVTVTTPTGTLTSNVSFQVP
jgi:uncharacterized repeat protein (TIGR03803 family)